jgi:uncharacterized protein
MATTISREPVADRIAGLDWPSLTEQLDEEGFAQTGKVYSAAECRELAGSFDDDERFRSTVDMRRYRFGEGDAPLPG